MLRPFIPFLACTLLSACTALPGGTWPDGTAISGWFREPAAEAPELPARQYVVSDYGVAAGSHALQTEKLQRVIDLAAADGGGVIVIPEGTFFTGALFFRPGTHLLLKEGAVLKGSDDIADFPVIKTRLEGQTLDYFAALVNADQAGGFTISGQGTIDGSGLRYWRSFWLRRKVNPRCTNLDELRPRLVWISNSDNVRLSGVTLVNSPFWTTHFYKCRNLRLTGLHITSPAAPVKAPSTDAVDLDACENVLIRDCYIAVNDDAIALKGGKGPWADRDQDNGGNRNILIENCEFGFCHSVLTCGSESVHSRNVILRDCRVDGPIRLLTLKMRPDTPQMYEDIRVENVRGRVVFVLDIQPWTQFFDLKGHGDIPLSHAKNVTLRDCALRCAAFLNVKASDHCRLSGFLFENLELEAEKTETGSRMTDSSVWRNVDIRRPAASR